ncbi:HAD-IIB family hydrolase [Marinobacter caseinilyticus]|uniref:HAD-IIB family hydrolase n=1 Tax=Marinobacter caseinilyticus TaxID=2692195 RepID=UPI0014075A5E|nr:HAD-IIB family hydrolase [Marinobacter caseinilyticus]
MAKRQLVVFTDLDGTLLDHDSYDWRPAKPALDALWAASVPVVLNSSKTRSEIRSLRDELGNRDPFIVENGAAVVIPENYFEPGEEQVVPFAPHRDIILDVLDVLKDKGFAFHNFDAMTISELARITGLSEAAAAAAKARDATEPLIWQGDDAALAEFRRVLATHQLQLLQGGRFYHVMGFFDKAGAMLYLMEQYREKHLGFDVVSVALGDSPNDVRMLEQADIPVIIRGINSAQLVLTGGREPLRSIKVGPAGWNECILGLLADALN